MKIKTLLLSIFVIACFSLGICWVLRSEHALVVQPKGLIAQQQLDLIITNVLLMLAIIVPTLILLLIVAWKYRANQTKEAFDPEHEPSGFSKSMQWLIPSIIVVIMSVITWKATHKLDPFRPLESDKPPLTIQVVAIDWKWLFIYPEQGIATVNFVQFPEQTPIRFLLSADNSPMNSFWLPQMSGQIYAMTGMVTTLHICADGPGEYAGRAAEINGEGYADMTFKAKSSSSSDFEAWVKQVKESPLRLTDPVYNELLKRTKNIPITVYSEVEKDLFDKIVMKPMHPQAAA